MFLGLNDAAHRDLSFDALCILIGLLVPEKYGGARKKSQIDLSVLDLTSRDLESGWSNFELTRIYKHHFDIYADSAVATRCISIGKRRVALAPAAGP